ncbi:MAG: hypothetical protein ACO3GE_02065 [Steroidobacteraceae bacterium]
MRLIIFVFVVAYLHVFSTVGRAATPTGLPAFNPYLAAEFNNQSHWNDAATDSTMIAVPRGHYQVVEGSYEWIPSEALGIPAYSAIVSGQEVHWFFSGTTLRKFVRRDGILTEIDRKAVAHELPDYQVPSDAMRQEQLAQIRQWVASGDEAGIIDYLNRQPNRLISAVEDQVAQGVLYSLLTRDHAFIGANARGLIRVDVQDPSDPASPLQQPRQITLPQHLFDDEKVRRGSIFQSDSVFGLGMSFNGYLVVNTVGGVIATLDRTSLELIDVYRARDPAELFSNSFATGDEASGGAIYVASNRRMYRLVVGADGRIYDDEKLGAWSAAYDPGERLPVGKISDGTGATPTLMGFAPGEDRLVVLTDGRRKMRLVAFWRDEIPNGAKRIADELEIDLGADFPTVQSEQSVVVYGDYAFVLNAIPSVPAAPLPVRGSYTRGLLAGFTRPLPRGIAMLRWDSSEKRWRALWSRSDIGTVATVPMISGGSRMVIVNGTIGDRLGDLYHLGFNLDDGELVMSVASGPDPLFNGVFTGIKCDRDGSLMYTTLFGLLRMNVDRMPTIQSPDKDIRKK